MARYIYDEKQVGATISTINEAIEELEEVNIKIKKGINTISNARGGNYININAEPILEYKTIVVDSIEALVSTIREKVALIEEYNNASWGEKAFSTISMGVTKFVEGLATAGEQIVDGFATITGLVVGIFSKDAKNEIGEFIKKDHVGDFFESAYDTGFLSSVEKYSAFSSQSTMANIFKGFGVATGYIVGAKSIGVAKIIPGVVTSMKGEQAYWTTKNQTESQSPSEYNPINIDDPSVSSTYEETPSTPPVETLPDNPKTTPKPSHIPDNPKTAPSTIPSGTNDGTNNVSTPSDNITSDNTNNVSTPISSVVSIPSDNITSDNTNTITQPILNSVQDTNTSSELSSGYSDTDSISNVGDNFDGNYLNNSPNATIDSYNTAKEKDNLNNNVDDNVNNTDNDNLKTIISVGLGTVGSAFVAYGAKKAIDKKKENDEI